jgi:hypothetical protein
MKDDKQDSTDQNRTPRRTKAIVAWVVGTGGAAMTLHPATAALGIGVAATAPAAGWAAERVHQFVSEFKARRVEEVTDKTRDRMEQEGMGDRFDAVKDIVIEAVPIIADADTEEKWEMISNIIINAAARLDEEAAKVKALTALGLIKEMSAAAALVFAVAAKEVRGGKGDGNVVIPRDTDAGYADLPRSVVLQAFSKLSEQHLIRAPEEKTGTVLYFEPLGEWLRDWIVRNPLADAGAAPPESDQTANPAEGP